jgi:hypothetical protein
VKRIWVYLLPAIIGSFVSVQGQIDPETRRLIQLGYNQPLEGRGPIAAYGFYYYNKPEFFRTNLTLRVAIAPIYLDTDLGFTGLIGPNTDVAVGVAGGAYADSYAEVRRGVYERDESFPGHGGEISSSVYHRFNPGSLVPLWAIGRLAVRHTLYSKDGETADDFELPEDRTSVVFRSGLRFGGREPSLTAPLAMELSAWYEGHFRTRNHAYGFGNDRSIEPHTHLFWGRGLIRYTFDESRQLVDLSLTLGSSVNPDRFSAYRLGGVLPFSSEFPLSIPGYYYQELSAKNFVLFNGQYSVPLSPDKTWNLNLTAATGTVGYSRGLDQPGRWHSGVGGGITYASRSAAWFVTLVYGHGFEAMRSHGRGAHQIGLLFQYDFEAKRTGRLKQFQPGVSPYRSRGGERLFR